MIMENPFDLDRIEHGIIDKIMKETDITELNEKEWTIFKNVIKKLDL